MKRLLMLAMASMLIASVASATVLIDDTFSYADGSLVGNAMWANHSGTAGDFLVASGQAVVAHGAPSEDVNHTFSATPVGDDLFFSFDFSVDDLGHPFLGTDNEYFAHFKDDGFNFRGRMDIVEGTAGGDYTVGISSIGSTADAIWGSDLTYGVTYRVVVHYDQLANIARLWIDPSGDDSTHIVGLDQDDPGTTISSFALRQSDSSENETIRVDNLIVTDTCEEVFASGCVVAVEEQNWGSVKSLFR